MNRAKQMAAAIIFILFLGIAITSFTKSITKPQETEGTSAVVAASEISPAEPYAGGEDILEEAGRSATVGVVEGVPKESRQKEEAEPFSATVAISPADGGAIPEQEAVSDGAALDGAAVPAGEEAQEEGEETGDAAGAAPALVLQDTAQAGPEAASSSPEGADSRQASSERPYEERLEELEAEAEKMKVSDDGSNQYVLLNAAENEYKLWDGELNRIYGIILDALTREEAEALTKEEREWIVSRDQRAAAAAKDSGGSMESLEYRNSLCASTRERVYELGRRYSGLLSGY